MSTTTQTPKSILKKPLYPATNMKGMTNTPRILSKADRDRSTALYHAGIIQQRKEIEALNLESLETLLKCPLSVAPYSSANPSPSDAQTFKALLRTFQPSDYDALIEERNIMDRCGYALCRNKRAKEEQGGKWRLIGTSGKARDFRVVEREELERWCCEQCAKRALYVRVQLSEVPAWERRGLGSNKIDLLDEPKSKEELITAGIGELQLGNEGERRSKEREDLALERGDKGMAAATNGLVDVTIHEKEIGRPAEAPSFETTDLNDRLDTMHLTLEGHTSTFGSARQRRREEEEEDDGPADWIL
ncbi:Protein-serine/threonine phosphatase/4-nitrophenylphosphatase [Chlorociboria aeruginascens]|nr:Protein-serine/threonine phosphatase/4-nitrophenylphosphatase [Chlorociboria aeruginascens]